jgi:crotonobetainyl-CoA:carnitine CoA-transferase CaiB-like acyl-CoA transferase
VQARDVLAEVDGVVMPGPVARLSRTPGRIVGPGRPLGADTDEVLSERARPEEVE